MIQVTGLFKTKQNGRYFENPQLQLVPQFPFYGRTLLEVRIFTEGGHTGGYLIEQVDKAVFDGCNGNAYDFVIRKLQELVISEAQEYNPACAFEIKPVAKELEK